MQTAATILSLLASIFWSLMAGVLFNDGSPEHRSTAYFMLLLAGLGLVAGIMFGTDFFSL